jgi:hypothetical protein
METTTKENPTSLYNCVRYRVQVRVRVKVRVRAKVRVSFDMIKK